MSVDVFGKERLTMTAPVATPAVAPDAALASVAIPSAGKRAGPANPRVKPSMLVAAIDVMAMARPTVCSCC